MNEIILHTLGIIEIIMWAWGICQVELEKNGKRLLGAGIIFALATLLAYFMPEEFGTFVTVSIRNLVFAVIIFKESIGRGIIKYLFSFMYISLVYTPVETIVWLVKIVTSFQLLERIETVLVSVITVIIVFFVGRWIKKREHWVKRIRCLPMRYYLIGLICSFCFEMICSGAEMIGDGANLKVQVVLKICIMVVSTFVLGIGMAFAIINMIKEEYQRESALKSEYLLMSKKNYENINRHMREVRRLKHDMQNHISILEYCIKNRNWQQAESYITEIKEYQKQIVRAPVDVGNELIGAVLTDILSCSDDIAFKCKGGLPKKIEISDFDLCTIFSNLLTNAIEACQKLENKEKVINLTICQVQNNVMILMENPIEWEIDVNELGKFTSKKEKKNHGYGIYNIKKTVESYSGNIAFNVENQIFQAKIIFFDVVCS